MCGVVLSLNVHGRGWELFAGLVSEHMGSILTVAPAEAQAMLAVSGCYGSPSPLVLFCCWGRSGCLCIPVENLCLFAVMEGVLGSCFQ